MKKYLGVKIVSAELQQVPETFGFIREHSEEREAYKVVYEDGYESWSPKDVFEKAYKEVSVVADKKEQIGILVNPGDGEWDIVGHVATVELPKKKERPTEKQIQKQGDEEATSFKEIKDPVIKNKIGFIKISLQMFQTESGIATLNALYKVVTPLRSISYDRCMDAYERMLCYCEQFREIETSERAPEYIATFTRSENGTITLTDLKEHNFNEMY